MRIRLSFIFIFLSTRTHTHTHTHTHTGVYLSLKGVIYTNNSFIPITEIGETNTISNSGLQCITDKRLCCRKPNKVGQWLFPDGENVPILANSETFYRNRGSGGRVNLNRRNANVTMPTGLFCCVVPDVNDDMQTVCANIRELEVNLVQQ